MLLAFEILLLVLCLTIQAGIRAACYGIRVQLRLDGRYLVFSTSGLIISSIELLDPQNWRVVVGILFLSCIEPEIHFG